MPSPTRIDVDGCGNPAGANSILFLDAVLRREQPFTDSAEASVRIDATDLLPADFEVVGSHGLSGFCTTLAVSARGTVLVFEYGDSTRVWISAASPDRLASISNGVRDRIPDDTPEDLQIAVWRHRRDDAVANLRRLDPPAWDDVARNYPSSVRARLDAICSFGPPTGTARLMLWHGEPGTGKTSAIMALLRSWADWCDGHLISDPERMFEEADYLLDVLMSLASRPSTRAGDGAARKRWKLVIAEDADEYLRSDARRRSGPALGRLLNATDGILGRGTQAIFLLTTNDEIGRLHPAITRPGRCLASIEFERFSPAEASEWLGEPVGTRPHGATLAELCEAPSAEHHPGVSPNEPLAVGAYL